MAVNDIEDDFRNDLLLIAETKAAAAYSPAAMGKVTQLCERLTALMGRVDKLRQERDYQIAQVNRVHRLNTLLTHQLNCAHELAKKPKKEGWWSKLFAKFGRK